MSSNNDFSNTSSKRYALALFELSEESKKLDVIEDQVNSILKLIEESKDFSGFIKDPTINKDDLEKVITKISDSFKLDGLIKNFLIFLVNKRRFFYVEQIMKGFVEICSEKRGELKAELKSAKELSGDELNKITDELTKNFSSKIKLNYKHDKSLIGGLIVQVGSTMVDTSIKNKLQQIENRMIEA